MPITAKALVEGFTEIKDIRAAKEAELVSSLVSKAQGRIDTFFTQKLEAAREAAETSNAPIPSPFSGFKYNGQNTTLAEASGKAARVVAFTYEDMPGDTGARAFLTKDRDLEAWPEEEKGPNDLPPELQKAMDGLTKELAPDFQVVGWSLAKLQSRQLQRNGAQQLGLCVVLRCAEFDKKFKAGSF